MRLRERISHQDLHFCTGVGPSDPRGRPGHHGIRLTQSLTGHDPSKPVLNRNNTYHQEDGTEEGSISTIARRPISSTYQRKVVPVRNRRRVREVPTPVHQIVLVSHQKRGQNQLELQFRCPHPRARVPASPPSNERECSCRKRVWSEPPTRVVLFRFGEVFRVRVGITRGIRDKISPFDDLPTDLYLLANVPSDACRS